MNGELYNPLTDVIDLEKYTIIENGVTDGEGYVWDTVTILTIIDDVIDDLTFKIVKNFNDFQAVNNATSDLYIMDNNIDCSEAQTMNETTADGDYNEGTAYNFGDVVTWIDAEGNIDRYIKNPYTTNYEAGKTPADTDTEGQKYWEEYNYEGFSINTFSGVFSGNGFELQNCYVNKVSDYAGVFSRLTGGKLSNVGVTGSVIGYGTDTRVGGLVGYSQSSSIITNSYSTCSVIGYGECVGGLIGYNGSSSSTTNSYSTGSVIGYGWEVGGLVGTNASSSPTTNSYSTGSVIGYGWGDVGGLIGYNSSSITNSYSTGSVIGYGECVGGLIGLNSSSITNSYSTGSVIGYSEYTGGFVGRNASPIANSYWDTETSGRSTSQGGVGRTTTQMKDIYNYLPEWDFSSTWAIDDDYPYLRMQVNRIDDNKDGKLVYNPLTDIIDINDTVKYPRGQTTTGSGDTLYVWETVELLTKLDDEIENKTFKIVKDFDDFQAVDNG
ncbi:MAG: hypothetical protein GX025_10515, partial [Clostridiales bacterium]|nr:hypothetical protein [Clostridiales bacterium]